MNRIEKDQSFPYPASVGKSFPSMSPTGNSLSTIKNEVILSHLPMFQYCEGCQKIHLKKKHPVNKLTEIY